MGNGPAGCSPRLARFRSAAAWSWLIITPGLPLLGAQTPGARPLEYMQARVYRAVGAVETDRAMALNSGVIVVQDDSVQPDGWIDAYTLSYSRPSRRDLPPRTPLRILAAGPLMDGPDQVEVASLSRTGESLQLDIHHTSARLSGVKLRRNTRWRPLASAVVLLETGSYRLRVRWLAVSQLSGGTALGPPTETSEVSLRVAAR